MASPLQSAHRRTTVSAPTVEPRATSVLAVAALAVGAAGFSFGAYFYLVPFQRKAAQLDRATKELAARAPARPRVDVQGEDAAARLQAQMKSLQAQIEKQSDSAIISLEAHRMRVRWPEEKLFDARGPYLTKAGQEALQTLGQLLGANVHRVTIAAPMGNATVPRWIRGQLPTAADLSAARAGNALKALVKGGVRAETVLAVIGTLTADETDATPTLDVEIEP